MMNEKQMIDSILYMLNEYDNMNDFLKCENIDHEEFKELCDFVDILNIYPYNMKYINNKGC